MKDHVGFAIIGTGKHSDTLYTPTAYLMYALL